MTTEAQGFDYIVVGAGSAGCVLANRLSANPNCRVALVEAGSSDLGWPLNLKTSLPIGNVFLLGRQATDWGHGFTAPGANDGREIPCPRGRLYGGSSSVNGGVYMRGHPDDYADWAALGNAGWDWPQVLAAFKAHEDWHGPASALHGQGGELDVSRLKTPNPISLALVAAAVQAGHAQNPDHNGAQQDGFGQYWVNQRNSVRLSSSRAFLHPALARRNLTIFSDALVERLELRGSRCTGLTLRHAGERKTLHAGEVVLSAGTIASPQLLMLSGIGPEAELRRHGIAVQHRLEGVGLNLQDHPAVSLALRDPSGESYALTPRAWAGLAAAPLRYLFAGTGMLASNGAEAGGFARTLPGLARPDVQFTLLVGLKRAANELPREHGLVLMVNACRPLGRGRLTLRSAAPEDRPVLHHGFLEHEADIQTLVRGLREARRIVAQPAMARFCGEELSPGPALQTDAQLAELVRQSVVTVYHPVGTCKMSPASDPLAVVDPELRVHGLEGLRVADASIMPTLIGGNTSAPAMMIGERAASFMLAAAAARHAA